MSCAHYMRKCKLWAPCCQKEFMCRICHDETESHFLDIELVDYVICTECGRKQEVAHVCNTCGILFGKYFCRICRLYDDNKEQFHCLGCGVCRYGGRNNLFHCPKCNICIPLDIRETHKCVEDMSRRKCPVCLEDLHASWKEVKIPSCSHMIHEECLATMLSHGKSSCPTCYESLVDMTSAWDRIDKAVNEQEMPETYRNYYVNILCRDCHTASNIRYHHIGLKCAHCGGYNTTRVGGDGPRPLPYIVTSSRLSVDSNSSMSSWELFSDDEDNSVSDVTNDPVTNHSNNVNDLRSDVQCTTSRSVDE